MNSSSENQVREDLVPYLTKVRIFSETGEDVLAEIAGELTEIRIRRGQNVFKKGDEGDAMYIIKSGAVRVHDGNHVLSRLVPGQVFGEFALFDKETRSASITADEETILLQLEQDDFAKVMANKADVMLGVLKKLIRRIREMNELESKLAKSYMKIQKQKSEIEEQHQQLLEKKQELEQTNEQLTRLNEDKNQLISVVSHGLRNPLTSSLCVADLLENEMAGLSEQQREFLALIHSSLRRMNSLINQTLDIDIIELQRDTLKPETLDLAEILEQIGKSFKYTLKLKKLDIDMKLEKLKARVDRNYFYLILDNLLSNAIRFSPSNKKIYIDLFERGGKAVVEISDEGPGISEKALKTLFDNPKQHDRQTDKNGLSISKKYVEAMGGEINCTSRPGAGTTFSVEFELA
ncbi:MAG TPA: HAMP domain-containing sensor histidine kinase [Bacteroidales bacterium]|nr:HAMP domain-containing sensor histidine kinase [Bacteroidales bacterium]